ncbi:hypothetical protein RR49_02996 [Microbacterium ginsengisoli]|uniref:Uncharacterized protein n=1 Tax=Microbacterium ginsengisoli TaxID=400772 RepID=A0A0F0LNM3_9MICO|nr:hypothetical protein [Microbacterium ginsengisoli]KJL34817.1 hypothetical protein RR49_02705 [Microbacterium ginsengisoli]KJL35098.1 hypothetical protein RR49_02996 [Microbacterium ginsengisoli]MBN9207624.1 hypothetical protein [Microbacterium ginsengisoli]
MTAVQGVPGSVTITRRAYEKVFAAITADALKVAPRLASAHVSDAGGMLRVAVTATASVSASQPLPRRLAALDRAIHDRGGLLTGARIQYGGARIVDVVVDTDLSRVR